MTDTSHEAHEAWSDLLYGTREHPGQLNTDDVARIDLAWCSSGHWEDTDQSFAWLVELKDGRWAACSGSCDYTGWGCRDSFSATIHATREDAIRFGLTVNDRENLGVLLPDDAGGGK